MAKKKNPRLEAHLAPLRAKLEAERLACEASLAPLYAERDAVLAQLNPLQDRLREIQSRIKPAEAPLRAVCLELAQIARTIGATSMPLDASTTEAAPGEVG